MMSRNAVLDALNWYQEQASALVRLADNPEALVSVVVAMQLDGGKRATEAKVALNNLKLESSNG
jgi:hypothetical protein